MTWCIEAGRVTERGDGESRWEHDESPTERLRFRGRCVDCGAPEPDESTGTYARVDGWTFARRRGRDGSFHAEWRCATCWRAFKARRSTPPSGAATE